MPETSQFEIPLIEGAQAQKHITANEAFARIDAVTQLRILSKSISAPPTGALDGDMYLVANSGVNEWQNHDDELAIFSNGGWVFLTPKMGWRAWIVDQGRSSVYDDSAWRDHATVISPGGAATLHRINEIDHTITAGATSQTSYVIPSGSIVTGVSLRVLADITGSGLTGWHLGISGSPQQYANNLGLSANTSSAGPSDPRLVFWSATPLLLTAVGGNFSGGDVRIAVHSTQIKPPRIP